MKNILITSLKLFKYLFYDIIPEFYNNIKWYKHDFDSKLDYYFWLPLRYLLFLIISLLDFEVTIYRLVIIFGFIKSMFVGKSNLVGGRK